jgi:NADH-quinone oxidoreductase subunit G
VVDAALAFAELDEVGFLSALRRGNVHGALDNGLAPGLLPGRSTIDAASDRFADVWPRVPAAAGLDAAGIVERAAAGGIDVLVLLGADPLNDFPDRELATAALDEVDTVIAIDLLVNDSVAAAADVVLAAAGPTETSGTFTNLEGRVSVVEQKVTPPGTARADWMLAAELASRLGHDLGLGSPEEIRAELIALSAVHEPLTGQSLDLGRVSGVEIPGRGEITPPAAGSDTRPANDAYSLRLVTRRTMYDDGVALRHSPSSRGLAGPIDLRLHPADFAKIGVEPGTVVRLVSERDHVMTPVRPDPGVPEGSAVIPWLPPGAAANRLIDRHAVVNDVRVERS